MERLTTLPSLSRGDGARPTARPIAGRPGVGDRIFRNGVAMTGLVVLIAMGVVGVFLTIEATDALDRTGFSFLTTQVWRPESGEFGIAAIMLFTIQIALIAIAISVPIALGTALFITEIAPPWMRSTLVALVDLMAAIPSVVYGLWGRDLLMDHLVPLSRWITTWFGWIPIFDVSGDDPTSPLWTPSAYTASTFIAGVVVAMMVMPIQCSVMREVFSQVPPGEREGAFALGSTRWGMIRVVSLPFGRAGMIGGTMLGLGRALGETIAVYLIISPRFDISFQPLESGSMSVSALIALRAGEDLGLSLSALFAAGLALFVLTLGVNFVASALTARARSGASSEA